ncbi:MAG: ribonuclease P protein component [Rhodospirillales bacterium]|jgi:ribonuclease P protein component|nr:ribonuclease P protein component [Rhodospirillales bacterium]MBT5075328.1 ribonuclease P protein component [Rhodospirillales bacterium]MBT5113019.1 ribonuclease P protein component [Rhodospirillales bacterium]MBT5672895.1 ribonuclease P protein component [Rhodospirillales bacterium]MBT6187572.1 ribonuclease P protein component [Rhodospirillales bacterium]
MMVMVLSHLKRRPEFLRVANKGLKAVAPGLVLQALDRDDENADIRVGFTTTRRIGNAVARNRARRRLRAVAREIMPSNATPGHDYVLIGRAATKSRPYDALTRDLAGTLKRLGLLIRPEHSSSTSEDKTQKKS